MTYSEPSIRIALADDHRLILQAYSSLLSDIPDFRVVGSAVNGREAIELLSSTPVDVLVLDACMPLLNGYETLRLIRRNNHLLKVIVLSMYTEPGVIQSFLINGANAFLGKNVELDEFIRAIRVVRDDGYYFSSTVSRNLVSATLRDPGFRESYRQLQLTERETEVLTLICEDLPTEAIARKLNISPNTIKFFRKNIYRKTKTCNAIGLIKYAIRHGIVAVE